MSRGDILDDISAERERQTALKAMGKFEREVHECSPTEALAVLAEEFGEVARVVAEMVAGKPIDTGHLREELIQVAAVCVSWVEGIDAQTEAEEEYRPQSLCGLYGQARTAARPPVIIYDEPIITFGPYTEDEMSDWQRDPELSA
jgi:NTP pyrophosphatase (non-canonical NTP hydrolase)